VKDTLNLKEINQKLFMENKTIAEKYSIFIDTLNLILLPNKEIGVSYNELIQIHLEELEGDYFTFLHNDFIQELYKNGYLTNEVVQVIKIIRTKISNLETTLWDYENFIKNQQWLYIRELVIDLFSSKLT
jgi:hypothetical protein